jgi:hypothetical protein
MSFGGINNTLSTNFLAIFVLFGNSFKFCPRQPIHQRPSGVSSGLARGRQLSPGGQACTITGTAN